MASDATKQTISQSLNELKAEVANRTNAIVTGVKIPELQDTLLISPTDQLILETNNGTKRSTLGSFGKFISQSYLASPEEVVNARTDVDSVKHDYLKKRLDSDYTKLKTRLDHIDRMELNILDFQGYVVGDDWTKAFEEAFKNAPCQVNVPSGTYNIKYIKIPTNSSLVGSGRGTVFNVIADGNTIHNIITNSDYDNGNTNILIKNFSLKCNRLTTTPPNGYGSGLTFANVKNGICENVYVENPSLHCFDVMADKTYQLLDVAYPNNATYDENKRSRFIVFKDCEGIGAGDDNFTCHYSDYITFMNCQSYANHPPQAGESDNRNGFEVDDGSKSVTLINCYTTGNARGFEVKAHAHSPAPENVTLDGCVAEKCSIGFQLRHLGHHSADEPVTNGKNVNIVNCRCVSPIFQGDYPSIQAQAVQISAYKNVNIVNFLAEGEADSVADDRAVFGIQYKARNINCTNITIRGFSKAKNQFYVVGGNQRADKVRVSNLLIEDGGLEGFSVGSGVTDVVLENADITVNGLNDSYGFKSTNTNPILRNIKVSNAQTNIKHGSKLMKDVNPKNVLWTGNAFNGGTTITLNDNVENYDYLLFDINIAGHEQRTLDFVNRNINYIKGINFENAGATQVATLYEMKLTKQDSTTILIEFNNKMVLPDMTFGTDDVGFYITKVTGVRL